VRWIPFTSFSFQTDLPLEAIAERAASQVEPSGLLAAFRRIKAPFRGHVSRAGFKVKPSRTWLQHQSMNVAEGRFTQTPSGVRVDVRFRLSWVMWAVFGTLAAAFLLGVWAQWQSDAPLNLQTVGLQLLVLAFLYVTTLMRFNREVGPASAAIQAWFGTTVRPDAGFQRPPPLG
jgi:hypothetical protein